LIVCHWQKQIPELLVSDQAVLNGPCGSAKQQVVKSWLQLCAPSCPPLSKVEGHVPLLNIWLLRLSHVAC